MRLKALAIFKQDTKMYTKMHLAIQKQNISEQTKRCRTLGSSLFLPQHHKIMFSCEMEVMHQQGETSIWYMKPGVAIIESKCHMKIFSKQQCHETAYLKLFVILASKDAILGSKKKGCARKETGTMVMWFPQKKNNNLMMIIAITTSIWTLKF